MTIERIKDGYRRARGIAKRTWRRLRGDLEAAHLLQHPDRVTVQRMHNRHLGQVGFLVGNGPSVRHDDLDQLQNAVTFCCNRFYLAYERTRLRPTYLCCADPHMMRDFGQEMVDCGDSTAVMMSVCRPALKGNNLWIEIDPEGDFAFSRNCLRPIHPGGATLIAALQFGYWMGIRRFILYGVDHSIGQKLSELEIVSNERHSIFVKGDGNHFIEGYRDGRPWCAPETALIETSFRQCSATLAEDGGWLINASRTSSLPHIDRVPFELALERARLLE